MSSSKKKKAVVLGAVGITAMSLLIGGITTANWSDTIGLEGAQITSGNLDIEKIGDLGWKEKSFDSPNFNGDITLADYRITPGDTIQGRQDLDVALEGKNLRATFDVFTSQLSGDLYSDVNGVSGNFMVIDENGFTVVPETPLGQTSPEVILVPDDVTPAVDTVKDYTFIVTVKFDENTPDQVRTQVQADLETMTCVLNQIRDGLMSPLPELNYDYGVSAITTPSDNFTYNGGTINLRHSITNTGSGPIIDLELRNNGNTLPIVSSLAAGETITFITSKENVISTSTETFEFFGTTDNGVEKLAETTQEIGVATYSASIQRSSSYSTNPDTGVKSVEVIHEITNTSELPVYNVVVSSDGLTDSNTIAAIGPGETKILRTIIPNANWDGGKSIAFVTKGEDQAGNEHTLSNNISVINAGYPQGAMEPVIEWLTIGREHSCEIQNGGEVWCWGRNDEGQLGNGTTSDSNTAVQAAGITDAVKIEAGQYNTFAITSNGDLYAWGDNDNGELGLGDNVDHHTPQKVNVSNVEKVSAEGSQYHSMILLDDGTVKVSGRADRIGTNNVASNVYIDPEHAFTDVRDISVGGDYNSYLINGDGTVWGTGDRQYKALNDYAGTNSPRYHHHWVQIGDHTDATSIQGRYRGAIYENEDAQIYGLGDNNQGELGLGQFGHKYLSRLPHYESARQIDFGWSHAVVLKYDGSVWTNGYNNEGQLGHGDRAHRHTLKEVPSVGHNITAIKAGRYSSLVITDTDDIRYAWGENYNNALGVTQNGGYVLSPQLVVNN